MTDLPKIEVIVPEDELLAQIDKLADTLAPRLTGEWTIVSILIGATPFTADLMKALLSRRARKLGSRGRACRPCPVREGQGRHHSG